MKYIYLHGFASGPLSQKAQFFVDKLKMKGYDCFTPDINGSDFTHLLISQEFNKLSSVLDSNEEYIVIGSSLGGLLALNLAEKFSNIKKLLLLAPAFNITQLWSKILGGNDILEYWKKNNYLEIPHYEYKKNILLHYKFVEDLTNSLVDSKFMRQIPVQIFHGLHDETIPYAGSVNYLQTNKLACLELLESDHSLVDKLDYIWQYSQDFLELM